MEMMDLIFWPLLCAILQVLALPGLVWKQLTGESVSWSKDFPAVDSVLVRTLKRYQLLKGDLLCFSFVFLPFCLSFSVIGYSAFKKSWGA